MPLSPRNCGLFFVCVWHDLATGGSANVGGQNSWELGGVEMEFLRII
ncbi:hypothetical protein HIG13_002414 [Escherichia coli]|nr:hypothetical protein [Escherichia coli]EFI7732509.1 hypothetical protein [Escherichia coli]EFI9849786.1 hypothetical protein [Escherichia coli]EFQ0012666.1 hypothetical protein [Shigella flexneri]EFQ0014982.1 hypothetical protein [Shigella flexneri]